ncbi:hypothetical protein [Rhizobium nepotum]|uniref:Uncharacterized protein n=1 Tax=Rhizobium nepotum 39/7 TaxID=1368418 RepID=A0ABR5CW38_9HYPH|nr:hypothetical protein [Rhizobium nepotum]KJF69056.1 hypothetical protein RS75_03525 [Rhizobium nepotum 39/7]
MAVSPSSFSIIRRDDHITDIASSVRMISTPGGGRINAMPLLRINGAVTPPPDGSERKKDVFYAEKLSSSPLHL